MREEASRPGAIAVVAAFLALAALVAGVVGIALLFPGTSLDRIWAFNPSAQPVFKAMGRVSGALLWVVGLTAASAAAGLMRGRRWAWWLAIGIFAVNSAGDVVTLLVRHDLVRSATGVLAAAVFLVCLLHRNSRVFFDQRH
jgi:hypothetical protein